ncbi:MAG TPA: caspase family protein [Oculatellaceae cyanobacterium]
MTKSICLPRKIISLLVALSITLLTTSRAYGQAKSVLKPAHTWLFAVGILSFQNSSETSWDSKNRRDTQLVEWAKNAGIPNDHIVYTGDAAATKSTISQKFEEFLPKVQAGDFLIVYYTGHGAKGGFETTDGKLWEMSSIVGNIDEHCQNIHVLLLGDCCYSGSLQDAISEHEGTNEYAIISSSAKTEPGHGNWTFSEALLQALRGNPVADSNKDGFISLEETKNFIRSDILTYENNHSAFATTTPSFAQMILTKANANAYFAPKAVEVFYHEQWWAAKQLETNGTSAHIRWMQLGYDSPDQDEWIELSNVRALTPDALR